MIHRPLFLASLASLASTGCGAVFFEGEPPTATATVQVERTEGGVVIVEQRPGAGFVMEGGLRAEVSAEARLPGFEGADWTTAATPAVHTVDDARVETSEVSVTPVAAATGSASDGWSAPAPGGITAAPASSPPSGASGGATGGASGSVNGSVDVRLEARADVPRDGVWGLDGRPTALTALAGDGVQVDGVRVALSDLAALAELDLAAPADAHLRTDGALEATAELEHDTLPRAGGETRVVVRVRANPVATAPRGRLRVHLVIDRSSSMQRTWERVLASARLLIERLQPDDELQIVAYGSDAIEAWPAQRVGDGRAAIRALEDIAVGGGTNVEAGLRLAYDRASTSDARSLCILLSDGVPNHGAFEPSELGGLAAAARQRGVVTSVIGLGTEFDARLLRAVARHGQGGYHVSADVEGLAGGLVSELEAHARAAARQVSVRVRVPEGAQVLGVEGDAGASITGESALLELPGMDVGETRNLVVRVRVPAGTQARSVASVELGYRGLGGVVRAEKSLSLSFGPRAAVAGGAATGAILNADLSASLDAAAAAVLHGDADAARAALLDHAALSEGRVEHRSSARLQARARVVRRVAAAVDALVPGASHGQRRQVSLSFGDLAARFGR